MIKEITKTITEKIKICDTCKEPSNYTCVVCGNDICVAHTVVVSGYSSNAYIRRQCNEKPFSEVWDKIYTFLNTTIITYSIIQYEYQYWYRYSGGTGDYWVIPAYTTSNTIYSKGVVNAGKM